jgi:hypothetical protein
MPFILAALLFLGSTTWPLAQGQRQEPPQSQKPPTPVVGCQLRESFNLLSIEKAFVWLHGVGLFLEGYHDLKSTAQAGADFKSWLEKNKGRDETPDGQCYANVSKYTPALITLLDGLRLNAGGLLYLDDDMPFRVFAKEKSEGVLLSAVTSGEIYNTLKIGARQRAAKEFDSTAMPILREMRAAFSQTPAQFYGVMIMYGTRDFSKDEIGGLDVHPDILAVVTDRENCRNLADGKITEDEFADKSDIYLSSGKDAVLVKTRLKFE